MQLGPSVICAELSFAVPCEHDFESGLCVVLFWDV